MSSTMEKRMFPHVFMIIVGLACFAAVVRSEQHQSGGPRVCPEEPQPASSSPCPPQCTSCDFLGRCLIINPSPSTLLTAPNDRPTIVRCIEYDSCRDLVVRSSAVASCDIICTFGACIGLAFDCRTSNHSCTISCEDGEVRPSAFLCDPDQACNCANTCGAPYNCTQGVNCYGDPCFKSFNTLDGCYPYRETASQLVYTSSPSCDCSCRNSSLVPVDIDDSLELTRYCVASESACVTNSQCGFGVCNLGSCECFNGWKGPRCSITACSNCANSAVCTLPQETCRCTGGFSGTRCDIESECSTLVPIGGGNCPAGCDECRDDNTTCIIHVRNSALSEFENRVSCPVDAQQMRCLFMCTSVECIGIQMVCDSFIGCDFVCATPGDCSISYLTCVNAGVPCRAHCTENLQLYAWGCPNQNTTDPCDACDLGTCEAASLCEPGFNCPDDLCYQYECVGGRAVFNNITQTCACSCEPGFTQFQDENGRANCLTAIEQTNCSCTDYAQICVNNTCLCSGPFLGPGCTSVIQSCPATLPPTSSPSCPRQCTSCDDSTDVCLIVNPSSDVACPIGWNCVVKCYSYQCQGIVMTCAGGAGPCDLYCFGQNACLMSNMVCETSHSCRSHCTDTAPWVNQVLNSHQCRNQSGVSSCDCKSSCPLQTTIQNPCYFSNGAVTTGFIVQCPMDSNGLNLLPQRSKTNPSQCECTCQNEGWSYDSVLNECTPPCSPPCNNGGRCQIENLFDFESDYVCACSSGYSGRSCDFRCFFPIPVEIISCNNGLYIIADDIRIVSNSSLNILLDSPDARIIRVNGSIIIQANTSASFASNTTNNLRINVGGNLTQSSGSVLITSITSLRNRTADGTTINVNGSAFLDGIMRVEIDPSVLSGLLAVGSGGVRFDLLTYGTSQGQFGSVTTNLPQFLPSDGCSKPVTRTEYGAKSLSLIITLDRSACSATSSAPALPQTGSGAASNAFDSTATVGAIVGVVVAVVVVAAIITAAILLKRRSTQQRNQKLQEMHRNLENRPATGAVEMSTPSAWRQSKTPSLHPE